VGESKSEILRIGFFKSTHFTFVSGAVVNTASNKRRIPYSIMSFFESIFSNLEEEEEEEGKEELKERGEGRGGRGGEGREGEEREGEEEEKDT
jgi:hypothetical protein